MMNNVSFVVDSGLCTSCGICSGSCPRGCISFKYGRERNIPVVDKEACISCGLCYDVCPGKGINLKNFGLNLFGQEHGIKNDLCSGYYLQSYVGHSTDQYIRFHSATGGMVTQFLIWLLEKDEIEGAVVVRYSKQNPLVTEPIIARTKEEILESRSSKYVVLSMDEIACKIAKGGYRKLVVVGLPCQIQGWRNLAKKNIKVKEAIIGYFAIFCSVNKTKLSLDYYPERYKVKKEEIGRFSFRDDGCMGFMKFENLQGKEIRKIPYLSFWFGTHSFFSNPRCSLCIDQLGELADVSFGDIHIPPYSDDTIGTNSLITRTKKWNLLLKQCRDDHFITLDEISIDTLTRSQPYTRDFKKGAGVKTNMMLRRFFAKANPSYDYAFGGPVRLSNVISETSKAIMRTIGRHQHLWWIVRLFDRSK